MMSANEGSVLQGSVPQGSVSQSSVQQGSEPEDSEPQVVVILTEADIPGALLNEPLETHNVAALKWWLLCHDINFHRPAESDN